ncbi:hypothetical protein [Streptomyces sp. NBC_00239]|uniref:hypothetical protein n=1 Tax=Streptomyces sp. NBC_00239 TaxID=2903640 RepID=UPI002E2A845A|nr:hypothetical protein [Streptomyces sp. NBC_00239]
MSHNQPGPYGQPQQPGPYGGQPQQPNPYGQQPQQPNPYGQPAPQPGYGYPQQAPQGVPQQGYGYPQQPGMPPQPNQYGQQPPTPPYGGPMQPMQPPAKKKTGLIVLAAIVAVAAIGGGAWFLLNGKAGNGDVSDATKGYKLVPPAAVAEFKKGNEKSDSFSSKDKKEAEGIGIKNPEQAQQGYQAGDPAQPMQSKLLQFSGIYGEIADPAKTLDASFALMKNSAEEDDKKQEVTFVGAAQTMKPAGFDGALMKCQDAKFESKEKSANPLQPKEFTVPMCIWTDYSTMGIVMPLDISKMMTGGKGYTLEQSAEYAAKLYNTARVKK